MTEDKERVRHSLEAQARLDAKGITIGNLAYTSLIDRQLTQVIRDSPTAKKLIRERKNVRGRLLKERVDELAGYSSKTSIFAVRLGSSDACEYISRTRENLRPDITWVTERELRGQHAVRHTTTDMLRFRGIPIIPVSGEYLPVSPDHIDAFIDAGCIVVFDDIIHDRLLSDILEDTEVIEGSGYIRDGQLLPISGPIRPA